MATKTRQRTRTTHPKEALKQEFVQATKDLRLLGEILTWDAGKESHSHKEVLQALKDTGLNEKVAREIMPRHAFTRACKKLTEERVIDLLRDEADSLTFQFTKRMIENDEWKYSKELLLNLNKITGKISCENKELEAYAQAELDRCVEARTTADITKMIQRLFDAEADLFPIRDQGGVYFVPIQYVAFTDKVEAFCSKLNGKVGRFPVPADTKSGDKSVQDAIVNGLKTLILDHEEAVAGFGLDTRHDTIERQAEKIKATRVKVEAYSQYLADKKAELEESLVEADRKLRSRVTELTEERKNAPVNADGGNRAFIFGYSMTAVVRWMGKNNWSHKSAKYVIGTFIGQEHVSDSTISAQLIGGRKGERGDPADLSDEQVEELKKRLADMPKPEASKNGSH